MNKNFYWWSGAIVVIAILVSIIVIDGQKMLKIYDDCKAKRIIPLGEKYFNWNGIVDLNVKGEYQPKCL